MYIFIYTYHCYNRTTAPHRAMLHGLRRGASRRAVSDGMSRDS